MSMAARMGCDQLADLFRITAILPLFSIGRKGDTDGMHPYFASRLAIEREEEFRRRAETYRLLAEVCGTEPRGRTLLEAYLRRAARRLRHTPRFGRPRRWSTGRPVPNTTGL
jgi:hypothetical protein